MSIKVKLMALTAVSGLGIILLVALSWRTMQGIAGATDKLLQVHINSMVNDKVRRLNDLHYSMNEIFEASLGLHGARLAEYMALLATEPKYLRKADKANRENIDQARIRMANASTTFDQGENEIYAAYSQLIGQWHERRRKIVTGSRMSPNDNIALRNSNG